MRAEFARLRSALDEFLYEHIWLMESDPDEFYDRLACFVTFVVCRSHRAGVRAVMERVRKPKDN